MSKTIYEAESSINTFYDSKIFEKGFCSNGKCVGWIGYDKYLQFNRVYVTKKDTYKITISYITEEVRKLCMCINNEIHMEITVHGSNINKTDNESISYPYLIIRGTVCSIETDKIFIN